MSLGNAYVMIGPDEIRRFRRVVAGLRHASAAGETGTGRIPLRTSPTTAFLFDRHELAELHALIVEAETALDGGRWRGLSDGSTASE